MTISEALELLESVPGLTYRAMFGGYGFYSEGRIFALMDEDSIYLKGDAQSVPDYLDAGAEAFVYLSSKGPASMKYYRFPSNEALMEHLDSALETAHRAPLPKSKTRQR
jgi:DNA transformation protein and related proteins